MSPVVTSPNAVPTAKASAFDPSSGSLPERLIFNNRVWVLLVCALLTAFFSFQLRSIHVSASFEKMLPQSHPYIRNYLGMHGELRGLGDSVRIVVASRSGDIFDKTYLHTLQKINDEVFLVNGVDRPWMKSIWTPVVRWTEVTEEGFVGGPVAPANYDGSPQSIENLKVNIARAGVVGSLVSNDYRSSMIVVPLVGKGADGKPLDYHEVASALERIRDKYESPPAGSGDPAVSVYVIGFAKLTGDLIDALLQVAGFFFAAAAIAAIVIFLFTRCLRSTLLVLACSAIAVVWQLGFVAALGFPLDPFSVLVPFLVFAIGVSHGAQKMNGIMQDVGRGMHRLVAARFTFRRLFLAGLTALLADAVGFGVLTVIDIPVIRELAMSASIGVAILIFSNLILLPVLLSYTGVSEDAARRSLQDDAQASAGHGIGRFWMLLDKLTTRRWALPVVLAAAVLGVFGATVSRHVQVGDLDAGAPELRAESRYNRDNAYIAEHYGISSDVFAIMVKSPKDTCGDYENLIETDRLAWRLAQLPGVQKVESLSDTMRAYTAGSFEGNPKWQTISTDQGIIGTQVSNAMAWNSELITSECALIPIVAYLSDHKAATLNSLVQAVTAFADQHDTPERKFMLAAGNAGIDATTNIVVKQANSLMLIYVYSAVIVLCFIAFRSWRAVIVAVLPLMLTSVLAEALMVWLGIGIKVATLPVVALGVGIGVDYALYLLSIQLAQQRAGASLAQAYATAVAFVGKVVALVGVTLAAGVITWAWSPIKFQADMGILLTFMFLWNMLGALILIPALSHFLLRNLGPKGQGVPQTEGTSGPVDIEMERL
jgi:predicted RND superfamily exporter protein